MQEIGYTGDEKAETPKKVTQGLATAGGHCHPQAAETNTRRQCFWSPGLGLCDGNCNMGELCAVDTALSTLEEIHNESGCNIYRVLSTLNTSP